MTDLYYLESVIGDSVKASLKIALALHTIHGQRLYKDDFSDFGAYCIERWDISRRQGEYLINVAQVLADLSDMSPPELLECEPRFALPKTQRQCRPLFPLDKLSRKQVWALVLDKFSAGDKLTEALVQHCVAECFPPEAAPETIEDFIAANPPRPYVRPSKDTGHFVQVWNSLFDTIAPHLGHPGPVLVLQVLVKELRAGVSAISDHDLAEKAVCSTRTLRRYRQILQDKHFFTVTPGANGKMNYALYDFAWVIAANGWGKATAKPAIAPPSPATVPPSKPAAGSGSTSRWRANLSQVEAILKPVGLSAASIRAVERSGQLILTVSSSLKVDALKSVLADLEKLFSMPVTVRC